MIPSPVAAPGGADVEAGRGAMSLTYRYKCSNGHDIAASEELETCPACVRGKPCDGEIRTVGRRRKRAEA